MPCLEWSPLPSQWIRTHSAACALFAIRARAIAKVGKICSSDSESRTGHDAGPAFAEKHLPQRRRNINRHNRTKLRTAVKKLRSALSGTDKSQATGLLPMTVSEIDKAVQKGVLHRNAAARHKSRLTVRATQAAAK